jgi:hypothetical protein
MKLAVASPDINQVRVDINQVRVASLSNYLSWHVCWQGWYTLEKQSITECTE